MKHLQFNWSMLFVLVAAAGVSMAEDADLDSFWKGEYASLSRQISKARDNNNKPASSGRAQHRSTHALIWESDRDALDVVLRRTRALLQSIADMPDAPDLSDKLQKLETIEATEARTGLAKTGADLRRQLYREACVLRRAIAFENPLLDFDEILVMTAGIGMGGEKLSGEQELWTEERSDYFQYIGFANTSKNGVGPMVLSDWKPGTPAVRKILKDGHGILKFHTCYDLHPDGARLAFAGQTKTATHNYSGSIAGHTCIFSVNVDGTGLTKLTRDDEFGDAFPCWLPNGRIAYVSECARWGGQRHVRMDRCGGVGATLWSMKADGSDAFAISWHETAEYHPVVDNDGKLVYSRWDYIDRSWDAAHHLWTCGVDGTDPRAPHGNYPYPHQMLDGPVHNDGRADRPWTEMFIRPIPHTSKKYIAIAGRHHLPIPGVPILINTGIPDDNKMSQVEIIGGSRLPHEVGGSSVGYNSPDGYAASSRPMSYLEHQYDTPWPLSEDYYLITDRHHVLLLDQFGNRELIYRWKGDGFIFSPRPLRSRPLPPELPTRTWQGERSGLKDHKRATISVMNVYNSDFEWPEGLHVKKLRIIQIAPAATPDVTVVNGVPTASSYGTSMARMVLGTVPVEEDGSAYFEAPVGKLIYFQTLDENNMAIQSMRSGTYVHPGEQLTCTGCHESKWDTPAPPKTRPIAFRRAPSPIEVELQEARPLTFYRLVEPVFQNTCLPCHQREGEEPLDFSYKALLPWVWYADSREWAFSMPTGGSRNVAGRFGARESRMGKALLATHGPWLSANDLHRVTLWLDVNSMQYSGYCATYNRGTYAWESQTIARQESGEAIWPSFEVDPKNPTGVESDRPLPD